MCAEKLWNVADCEVRFVLFLSSAKNRSQTITQTGPTYEHRIHKSSRSLEFNGKNIYRQGNITINRFTMLCRKQGKDESTNVFYEAIEKRKKTAN